MRPLRLLPAGLPDVSRHGRRIRLPSRTHRADARPRTRRAVRRRSSALLPSRSLSRLPRLRARVPIRRPIRSRSRGGAPAARGGTGRSSARPVRTLGAHDAKC